MSLEEMSQLGWRKVSLGQSRIGQVVGRGLCAALVGGLSACNLAGAIEGQPQEGGYGPGGGTISVPNGGTPNYAEIAPIRRLTNFEFINTVRDLLPMNSVELEGALPPDDVLTGFNNNAEHADIAELRTLRMIELSEQIATDVSGRLGDLLPCSVDALNDTCAEQFVTTFGRRAFRRPLSADEVRTFMDQYRKLLDQPPQQRLEALLMSFLMAPQLHFRPEVGNVGAAAPAGQRALTGYEVAARLSYFLWATMPDEGLLAAAESGELNSAEGIQAQAERLLSSEQARAAIGNFAEQLIHAHTLPTLTKDPTRFAEWNPELVTDLAKEARLFFERGVLETDTGFHELIAGQTSYVNSRLAELYGIDPSGLNPDTWEQRPLPEAERSGVLTLPAFLAAAAQPEYPSIVKRGLFVRRQLLCQTIPAPPAGAADSSVIIPPGASNRERRIAHSESGTSCGVCHSVIDPPGFALENYDAIGRYQTMELTLEGTSIPINASGELVNTDVDGPFANALELTSRLEGSREVAECMTRQWFRYNFGRTETEADEQLIGGLTDVLMNNTGDIKTLFLAMVTHDMFRHRPVGDLP